MTLSPCYRATCDAPGCGAGETLVRPHTAECRLQLETLGWTVVRFRGRARSGAAQILYACPAHGEWRPPGWREAALAVRVEPARRPHPKRRTKPAGLQRLRRAAIYWMLAETLRSEAALARTLGQRTQRVSRVVASCEADIARRQESAAGWVEPWARRLRAAGAIP